MSETIESKELNLWQKSQIRERAMELAIKYYSNKPSSNLEDVITAADTIYDYLTK